ncbi:MAG: S-layer homology domain-containing protein [Firmicutes bacterium]|nr:S-layer homology domain-containing protein [Bacillota bacterium]
MKKIFSLILAVSMAISVSSVFGEEIIFSDVSVGSPYYESVADLFISDIIHGYPDGTFKADKQMTRAEAAKVIMLTVGGGNPQGLSIAKGERTTGFTDVETTHWVYDYIGGATDLQIVSGNGDGTFLPDENVTYGEVVKMIVCAMGYEVMAQSRGMSFPVGYAQAAANLGVTEGISFVLEDFATRGNVAKLIHTALDLPIMEQVESGSFVEYIIMDGKNDVELRTLRIMRR